MFQEEIINESIVGSKILIFDDNTTNLKVLADFLGQYPLEVITLNKPDSLIETIIKEQPDLLLLDIVMPKGNGFEICKTIKNNPQINQLPIVFLSALSDVESIIRGFECGGVDFITKPVRQEVLLARVTTQITLRKQQQQLEKMNETKDRFFSIISHDLRSPFMSLIGLTNLLSTAVDEYNKREIEEIAEKLSVATRNTYSLLENLLEWSKLQYGALEAVPEETEIIYVVKKVINLFKQQTLEKNINVEHFLDEKLTAYVDENVLYSILRNLMSNAIRHTSEDDKIIISAKQENEVVVLSVIDEGEGIDKEDLKKLMLFEKPNKKRLGGNKDGSGIGLIICNELIKLSKGEFKVESKVGGGSRFSFTLPISKSNN